MVVSEQGYIIEMGIMARQVECGVDGGKLMTSPLRVPCPKCGAVVGRSCTGETKGVRRVRRRPHSERILMRAVTPVFIRGSGWGYPLEDFMEKG